MLTATDPNDLGGTSEGASSAAELKIPGLGGDPGPRALPLPLPLPLLAQTMLSAVSCCLLSRLSSSCFKILAHREGI